MTHLIKFAVLSFAFATSSANAEVYCKSVGVVDSGISQPGAGGNVGVGTTPTNRGGPVDRAGRR